MSWRLRFPENYRARYYNATVQRFISEDPLGFGGGDVNFYAYVGDDPIDFTDPFGLDKNPANNGPTISAAPPQPWYKNSCITSALGDGALHGSIDAIGFIPEAGGIARTIGHGGGYRGVVADQLGHNVVNAVGKTAGTVSSAAGVSSSDWTSWVSAGITVGDFIPVVNEFTTVAALAWDTGVTAYKVYQCPK